jgi:hypothetical protein
MSEFRLPGEPVAPQSRGVFTSTSGGGSGGAGVARITVPAGGFEIFTGADISELRPIGVHPVEEEVLYREVPEAFEAIRAGLQTTEAADDLKKRVARAVARANEAHAIGQRGLSQDLVDTAAGWVLEQQAASLGCGKWIFRRDVDLVIKRTEKSKKLSLVQLSAFPRIIPTEVQAEIKRTEKVFNTFYIVFTNPKDLKVKDRDPVLFGVINAFPDRLYYITDWIDEYCDLTLEKFIKLGEEHLHAGWKVKEVPPEPTDDDLHRLVERFNGAALVPFHGTRGIFSRVVTWVINKWYRL